METDDTKWWSAQLQNMLNDKANDFIARTDKTGTNTDEAESYVLSIRALQESIKCATTPNGQEHDCQVGPIMETLSSHGEGVLFAATGLWAAILRKYLNVPESAHFGIGVVDSTTSEMLNPDDHGDRHQVAGTRILVAHLNGQHATARDHFVSALNTEHGEMAIVQILECATGMLLEMPPHDT